MKKVISLFYALIFTSGLSIAQIGGKHSFQFLELSDNARQAALGGDLSAVYDFDVNAFQYNPAALNSENKNKLGINYLPFYAKVKKSSLNYAWEGDKTGMWGIGASYINYGQIDSYDAQGRDLGEIQANEYALYVTKSHVIGPYSMGVTAKFIGSNLSGYNAIATSFDVGGVFVHPKTDFRVGLTAKNIGFLLNDYHDDASSSLPMNVQLGLSYKPEHMPFRFHWNLHHLNNWKLVYVGSDEDRFEKTAAPDLPNNGFVDQLFTHMTFGLEAAFSDNFHLRAGYNHQRRKEMIIAGRKGMAGFSLGAMLRIKAIELNYTKAFYHLEGGTNNLSLSLDLNSFVKKEKIISAE